MTDENLEQTETEQYPLDFDKLEKGSVLPIDKCEELTGLKCDHRDYPLALLRLCDQIKRACDLRGKTLAFRCHQDTIEIMEDGIASHYYEKKIDRGQKMAKRALGDKIRRVDVSQLTTNQAERHERVIMLETARLQAGKSAIKRIVQSEKQDQLEEPQS